MRRTYLRGIEANSTVMPISWKALKRSSTHSDWAIFLQPSASFVTMQGLNSRTPSRTRQGSVPPSGKSRGKVK